MKYVAKVLLTGVAALLIVGAYASRAIAAPPTPTNPSPGSLSSPGPTTPSSSVTLSWSASSGATYYGVAVRDIATSVLVVDINVSGTSYTANLSAGKQYRWNVNACNGTGCSSFTTVLYFQTPTILLAAPTLLTPSHGATGVSITPTLNWSSVSGANRYWLIVATSTSVFPTDPTATTCPSCVISGNTDALSYTVPNSFPYGYHTAILNPGTVYYWKVQGWNTNGTQGNYSTARSFATAAAAPGVPVLTLTAECSGTTSQIRLNWTAASGATSYDVYRNFAVYATGITGTQFINNLVTPGTTYNYSILARNSSGSTGSSTKSATAPSCAAVPGVPVLTLTAECSGTTSQIRLNWTAASGATSYDVYRNFAVYATGVTGTQFINNLVTPGTAYSYSVLARNSSGSTGSSTKSATAPSCAAVPGVPVLTLTPECSGTTSQIRLNWTSTSGATSYDVYRNFAVYTTGLTGTQFINTAVTPGTTYSYSVLARNSSGSTGSATQSATAPSSCSTIEAATFVSETILDGTTITAGQSFTKSWTIRNSGTTTWNSNYRLRWISGANLSNHSDVVIAGTVAPGSIYTFIVPMTAPTSGGTYREDWKLVNGNGTTIPVSGSSTIWVSIKVADSSGTDKADFVAETYLDGTTVPAGQGFTKSWTVRNSGTTTWSSNYRLRWVSGASLSNHADVPINGSVPPGSNYTFSVLMTAANATGTYREDWKLINSGGATVPISGSSTIWVSVRVNVGGQSSITGSVTSSSGVPIAGANLQIGSNNTQSNSQGTYSISNITAGDYTATVSKVGYETFNGPLSITTNTQARMDFTLQPSVPATSIIISSIGTKYSGRSYFLNGLTHNVLFTVNVNWGGHNPGRVIFITPRGSYDAFTSSTTASRAFDMGIEFGVCGKLRVKAVSSDGTASAEKEADFVVMSRPSLVSDTQISDNGGGFYYKSGLRVPAQFDLLEELINEDVIPGDIPAFGREQVSVTFKPLLTSEVNSNGQASFKLSATASKPGTFENKLAGYNFGLTPQFELAGRFNDSTCKWNWSGSTGIDAFLSASRTVRIPWTLYLGYLKGTVEGSAGFHGEIFDIDPPNANLKFNFNPKVRGAAGFGLTLVYAIEAWVKGDARYQLQYPQLPKHSLTLSIQAGYSKFAFGFEKEHEVKQWNWDLLANQSNFENTLSEDATKNFSPRQISRDYLRIPGYGKFLGAKAFDTDSSSQIRTHATTSTSTIQSSISAIQTTVLPFSDAQLSSGGPNLYLTWLYDNPERTAINRSVAVSSSWNGTTWTEPMAIADDGTADFHPQILTFPDGSALAAWEDSDAIMPDTTSLEALMAKLEISASLYDPQAKRWVSAQRLTTNSYIDRSPKLAGPSAANTLVVWISNSNNDLDGDASHPNTLWASKWNGASWTTPQTIATLPSPIVKYTLAYDGNEGYLVMAVDTDQDQKTNEDHELYQLSYSNGVWGSMLRLTNDNVADDNPQLALDSKRNPMLVWLKGDEVSSSANLDTTSRKVVARLGYSVNLADFKLAATPEGKIALVWSEASGSSDSDLQAIFYDQNFDVWGNQTQLTSDPEIEKYITTAFYGQNNLLAVYDRTNLPIPQASAKRTEGGSGSITIPTPGTTDLYMLSHPMGDDLAIRPNTLAASPTNPRPGEVTTLTATIVNQGDNALQNVPVSFYQGNPASGGILIGATIVSNTLPAGSEQQVSVTWTPGSTTSPFSIYVVVDPNQTFTDANRANNEASKQVVKPDLAIQSIRWERQTENSVVVIARVVNLGSLPTLPTSVSFRRDSSTGTLLSSPAIGGLNPDQSVDVAIQWDTTGLNAPEYTLYLLADPNNSVDEYDKTNNVATLVVSLNANAATIQLILEQSGFASHQVLAIDSVLFTRDPFLVTNPANLLNPGPDRNTRVMIFITNLQLAPGETSSSVVVNLIDSNNQSYDISAEDVRSVPNFDFTQVIFRLPNNLPVGTCTIKLKAHGQVSNAGTIRIRI